MWFKHRAWIPISWLLSIANVGAVWFAALPGETWHATAHALAAVLFAVGAERLTARRRVSSGGGELTIGDERMNRLEEAIESIALEVERVGEGQRFVTKLLAEPDRSMASRDPIPVRRARANEDAEG
jgi:hypothetical protein